MELVSKAIIFATKAHDGMRRKSSSIPYIIHPLEAAVIVSTMTEDQEVIAAAVLHDVVEDTQITSEQILSEFGKRVQELVASETENKRNEIPSQLSWKIRKEESLEVLKNATDINVLKVWLGDKLANVRSLYEEYKLKGNDLWLKFNQKDQNEQAWYYFSIAEYTKKLSNYRAWQEYNDLIKIIFEKRREINEYNI